MKKIIVINENSSIRSIELEGFLDVFFSVAVREKALFTKRFELFQSIAHSKIEIASLIK
jgi:hypothetical protein